MGFRTLRATGLVAVAALQIPWLLQPIPLALKLAHVAFVGLAIARPAMACLVLAGIGSLTYWILAGLSVPIAGTRLLEQLVLAVVTGAVARYQPTAAPCRTAVPAMIVSLVAVASAAAVLPGRFQVSAADAITWHRLLQLWQGAHFNPDAALAPFVVAVYTIEGMALLWAIETIVRREERVVDRVILCSFIGHAMAAALNVVEVAQRSARADPSFATLLKYITYSQVNVEYDHNALGAVFVLVALTGIGFLARPWWRAMSASAMIVVLLAGVWLTRSRTAAAVFLVALAAVAIVRSGRHRKIVTAALVMGFAVLVWMYSAFYPQGRNDPAETSVAGRLTMAKVALRMTRTAPAFGVGIGTFYEQSTLFGAPYLENAHNNSFHILAEQGVTGLAAAVALIAAILMPVFRSRSSSSNRTRRWLVVAVMGFLLTGLTGHPMLEPDAVFAFWLLFGVLAGVTPAPTGPRRGWVVAIAATVLAVSLPVRIVDETARQAGIGLSTWHRDSGGAYRYADSKFSLYLPTNRTMVVPVRTTSGPVQVEMRHDGQLISVVTAADGWSRIPVRPLARWGYQRMDFTVITDPAIRSASPVLKVGEIEGR